MDYNNPFGGYDTNQFSGNAGGPGFVNQWETGEQTIKNEHAKQFMEMSKQSVGLDLQKKQQENQEFMSPEAKQMRAKEIIKKSQQMDADIARINPTLANDLRELDDKMQLGPLELANKKLQAQQLGIDLKDKPVLDFVKAAADYGNAFSKDHSGALMQAADYKKFVDAFHDSHPNTTIPPNLETWSDNLGTHLKLARMASLYSTAHEQKLEEEKLKNDTAIKGHQITAGATVQAARVTAEAANYRADLGQPTKDQASAVRVQDLIEKAIKNDPTISAATVRAYGTKSEIEHASLLEMITNRRNQIRQEIMTQLGDQEQPTVNTGDGIAMPSSQSDLKDGKVYNTSRGKAKWNASTKKFSPI